MKEYPALPSLGGPVFRSEDALLVFADVVGVPDDLDHPAIGQHGQPDGDVLLWQRFRLVGFKGLIGEHDYGVVRMFESVRQRGEEVLAAVGDMSEFLRDD